MRLASFLLCICQSSILLCLLNSCAKTTHNTEARQAQDISPEGAPESTDSPTATGDDVDLIVGGRVATKKSDIAATTVSLMDTEQGALCTASLLTDSVAITAAHCIGSDPSTLQIAFGTRATSREVRPVVAAVVSPRWAEHHDEQFNNGDIALIRFEGGLPAGARPATIMRATHHLTKGEVVTLAGYGITNGDGTGAGTLRTVDIKIADANYSQSEVSLDQSKHKGACHGDSGGPAFVQNNQGELLLWGVTSRGIRDPKDQCAGMSVYTRVLVYAKWINRTLKAWSSQ